MTYRFHPGRSHPVHSEIFLVHRQWKHRHHQRNLASKSPKINKQTNKDMKTCKLQTTISQNTNYDTTVQPTFFKLNYYSRSIKEYNPMVLVWNAFKKKSMHTSHSLGASTKEFWENFETACNKECVKVKIKCFFFFL